MDSFPETYNNPFLAPSYSFEIITGIYRSDLGDYKANVKKAIGLISKTTTLHVHNTVCSFFLPSSTTTRTRLILRFMDHATSDNEIFFLFLNLGMVLRNSTPKVRGVGSPL